MRSIQRYIISILLLSQFSISCKTGIERHVGYLEKALQLEQEKLDRIWPGYNFRDYAIALYNDSEAYLINHPAPGSEFTDTGRFVAGMTLHYAPVKVPEFNANTSIIYNDKTTAIFKVFPGMRAATFYGLLFHEVFHSYAKSIPGIMHRSGNLLLQPFFPADDPEYYSLALIEQKILQDAVGAASKDQAAKLFREYMAVNRQRTGRTDSSFAVYETEEQVNEGIAEYAGNMGLEIMGFTRTAAENFHVMIEKRTEEPAAFRLRTYGTGCALALLLDRFNPNWKTELTLEKTLPDLLREKIPLSEPVDLPDLLKQRNFSTHMNSFKKALELYAEKQSALRAGILSAPHILIKFPRPEFANLYFDPMNITNAGEEMLHHSRYLKLFNTDADFELELSGTEALTAFVSGNMFLNSSAAFRIPGEYELTINGASALLEKDLEYSEMMLTASGISLKIRSGYMKFSDGNVELIVIQP